MSIVVFDPDSVDDVDFKDRMRHPEAADPAGGMWLSDTEPSFIDADALRKGRLKKLRDWMRAAGYGAVVLFDPYNQRYATGSGAVERLYHRRRSWRRGCRGRDGATTAESG